MTSHVPRSAPHCSETHQSDVHRQLANHDDIHIIEPDSHQNLAMAIKSLKLQSEDASTCLQETTHQARQIPRHIFDLPDEILVQIFRYLGQEQRGTTDTFLGYSVPTAYAIQNARLTCQRFCSTSSAFLLCTLFVEQSPTSLTRLHNILTHPTFAKSVTAVKIRPAWRPGLDYGALFHTTPTVPALLAGLDVPGTRITSLEIDLSVLEMIHFARLTPASEDARAKIWSALRNLKELKFRSRNNRQFHDAPRNRRQLEVMADFFTLLIHGEYIETLSMDLNWWGLDPSLAPSVSLIVSQTDWRGLSTVVLRGLTIQYSDLEHLLRCTKSPKGAVRLREIHLMDRSWVPVLDILRERNIATIITAPSGAECEDMDVCEYDRVFGKYYARDEGVATEVEQYILGRIATNPLLCRSEVGPEPELDPEPELP